MIINQETKEPITDFVLKFNVRKVFDTLIDKACDNFVDTEELKVFLDETEKLLKSFEKHVEKVEKEAIKVASRQKFNDLVSKGLLND